MFMKSEMLEEIPTRLVIGHKSNRLMYKSWGVGVATSAVAGLITLP